MGCGCKKKKTTTQQQPMTIVLNETENVSNNQVKNETQTSPDNQVNQLLETIKKLSSNQ